MNTMYGGALTGQRMTHEDQVRALQLENQRAAQQQAIDLSNLNAQVGLDQHQRQGQTINFNQLMAQENMRRQGAVTGQQMQATGQQMRLRDAQDGRSAVQFRYKHDEMKRGAGQQRLSDFVRGAYAGQSIDDLRPLLGQNTGQATSYIVDDDGSISLMGRGGGLIKTIPSQIAQAAAGIEPPGRFDTEALKYEKGVADANKVHADTYRSMMAEVAALNQEADQIEDSAPRIPLLYSGTKREIRDEAEAMRKKAEDLRKVAESHFKSTFRPGGGPPQGSGVGAIDFGGGRGGQEAATTPAPRTPEGRNPEPGVSFDAAPEQTRTSAAPAVNLMQGGLRGANQAADMMTLGLTKPISRAIQGQFPSHEKSDQDGRMKLGAKSSLGYVGEDYAGLLLAYNRAKTAGQKPPEEVTQAMSQMTEAEKKQFAKTAGQVKHLPELSRRLKIPQDQLMLVLELFSKPEADRAQLIRELAEQANVEPDLFHQKLHGIFTQIELYGDKTFTR